MTRRSAALGPSVHPRMQPLTLVLLTALVAAAQADGEDTSSFKNCYAWANKYCDATKGNGNFDATHSNSTCHSLFGGFKNASTSHFQGLVQEHLVANFQFLLFSSHFANYGYNRAGFAKLHREMADAAWNDAREIVEYATRRGETVKISHATEMKTKKEISYTVNELPGLAHAIDIQKKLADSTHTLHRSFSGGSTPAQPYDADASSFLENQLLSKQSKQIRTLAGHASDLSKMLGEENTDTLALFFFDQYLQQL